MASPVFKKTHDSYKKSTPGAWNFKSNAPGVPNTIRSPSFSSASKHANVNFNAPEAGFINARDQIPGQFHNAGQYAPDGWNAPRLREGWDAPTWQGFNAQDFEQYKDPGYHMRLAEGERALMRQAAAGSGAYGGSTGKALVRYGQQQGANEFAAARGRAMQDYQTRLHKSQLNRQVSQQDYQNQLQQRLYDRQFGQQDFLNQQGIADRHNQFNQQRFQNFNNVAQQENTYNMGIADRDFQAQQQRFSNFNNIAQQRNAFAQANHRSAVQQAQQQYQNQVAAEQQRRRQELEDYKIAEARAVQNRAFNMQDLAQENAARAAEFAQLTGMSNQGLQATGQTISGGNQATGAEAQSNLQGASAAGQGAMGAANAAVQGYQYSYNAWRDQAAMSAQMSSSLFGMAGTIIGAGIM